MASSTKNVPQFCGITFGSGDFVSLFSLFFDNLSTLLGLGGAILGLSPTSTLLPVIVYERIVPAAGVMLFVGNVYYTFQAIRMRNKFNKPYTAQPYGLNTSGGFPFVFGIIYSVYFSWTVTCTDPEAQGCDPIEEENRRVETAWQVCVAANFLTGIINIVLGLFGPLIMNIFPVAAMLVPLAGIGFTWLALNQIAANFETPAIGLIPVFLIFTQYYAMGRVHVGGGYYLPEALPIVIFGTIAGWAYGTQDGIASPANGGIWFGNAFIEGFKDIGDYLGVVLPFSIAASFGDMMVLVSAQKAGDPFPIRETMISDGIGTLIGSLLGAPFGTVVYIGHPVHKRVGAQTGYSIMNGCVYLALCLSGVLPVILSLIPAIAVGPIIFIFGLMICEEATRHVAQRHHAAIFFGLFFGVCDYIYTNFSPANTQNGPNAMSKGSALLAMFWSAIIVYAIDRRWMRSAVFCVVTAVFSGIGIIHQDSSFENFTTGFQGINNSSPFQFMMGYLSLAGVCVIYYLLQTYMGKTTEPGDEGYEDDHGYLPPIVEEGVDRLFDTWWDPATGVNSAADPEEVVTKKVEKIVGGTEEPLKADIDAKSFEDDGEEIVA